MMAAAEVPDQPTPTPTPTVPPATPPPPPDAPPPGQPDSEPAERDLDYVSEDASEKANAQASDAESWARRIPGGPSSGPKPTAPRPGLPEDGVDPATSLERSVRGRLPGEEGSPPGSGPGLPAPAGLGETSHCPAGSEASKSGVGPHAVPRSVSAPLAKTPPRLRSATVEQSDLACAAGGPALLARPGLASGGGTAAVYLDGRLPLLAQMNLLGLSLVLVRLLWPVFTRLHPADVAGHPRRARILEYVRHQPGTDIASLARAIELPRPVVRYHLSQLARHGLVTIKRLHGRIGLFLPCVGNPVAQARVAILRRASIARIYEALRARPAIDQMTLSRVLGVSQQRISDVLRRLRQAELADFVAGGGRRQYFARPFDASSLPTDAVLRV